MYYHKLNLGEAHFYPQGVQVPLDYPNEYQFDSPTILLPSNTSRMVIIHETLHYIFSRGIETEFKENFGSRRTRLARIKMCRKWNLNQDCSKYSPLYSQISSLADALWGVEAEHYDIALYLERNADRFRFSKSEINHNLQLKKVYEEDTAWIFALSEEYLIESFSREFPEHKMIMEGLPQEIKIRLEALK